MRVSQAYFDVLASAGHPGPRAGAEDRRRRAAGLGQAQFRGRHLDHHRHPRGPGPLRPGAGAGDRGRERPAASRRSRSTSWSAAPAPSRSRWPRRWRCRRCSRPTSNAWVAQAEEHAPRDPAGAARRWKSPSSRSRRPRPATSPRWTAQLATTSRTTRTAAPPAPPPARCASMPRSIGAGLQHAAVRGLRDREPGPRNAGAGGEGSRRPGGHPPQRRAGHAHGLLRLVSGAGQVKALEAAEASSQSALDANRLGYQVGVRINIDVLNSQSQLFQTKRDLALARYNVLLGNLKLRQANGTLSPTTCRPSTTRWRSAAAPASRARPRRPSPRPPRKARCRCRRPSCLRRRRRPSRSCRQW